VELESEHGRRVMGVLLFQDLAVVPLLVLIPALGSRPTSCCWRWAGPAQGRGAAGLLLVGGQRVMRWWLTLVAGARAKSCSCSTCCWSRWAWPG
jgi:CPA2 family monovalent cation:H+ antiporter-2